MVVPNHHVWLHSQEYCQPAIVHEVVVSASGSAVEQFDFSSMTFRLLLCSACAIS